HRHIKKLESSALAVVQETLGALRVVKAFGGEQRETDRFAQRSREGVAARIRMALTEGRYGLLVGVTTALGTGAVLFIGVRHVQANLLTLGQLLMAVTYLGQLYEPLKTVSKKAATLQSYLASAERAFALLDQQPEVPERPDAPPLERARGALEFRGVSFAYGPDRPVLHDVSCVIPPGTRLGIVGATGAGKTTLISLLTRFYDPQQGAILLDGTDLRAYRLTDLRRQFAVVLQEAVLFSSSIAGNVTHPAPRSGPCRSPRPPPPAPPPLPRRRNAPSSCSRTRRSGPGSSSTLSAWCPIGSPRPTSSRTSPGPTSRCTGSKGSGLMARR